MDEPVNWEPLIELLTALGLALYAMAVTFLIWAPLVTVVVLGPPWLVKQIARRLRRAEPPTTEEHEVTREE